LKIAGGEFVELNWTQSADPHFMQYDIYVSTNRSALGTKVATITSVGSTTYTYPTSESLEGLDPGKTYYFSVVVVDQAGLSSGAATASVTTRAPMNWPLMGGIAIAVELAIGAIFVVFKLFIKKK
jgi:predicted phage tail protein